MKHTYLAIILSLCLAQAIGQEDYQVVDDIIAVVGNEIVLLSEIETQKGQLLANGLAATSDLECQVIEATLFERLLLHQSRIDSIEVGEDRIQGELDRRITMFSKQLGGTEKLETFYQKSIAEIRSEFHDAIEKQLLVQTMQQEITSGIRITPADVESFFNSIPEDSIPLIESEVEVSQIMIKPKPSAEEKQKVKGKLNKFRDQVQAGEKDFETLAVIYSEDPGSATKGGELGLVGRGEMVSVFEQVAYNLKEGEISHVFESDYGYHIMQMIERKGDLYNARHILIKPKVSSEDLKKAKSRLAEIKSYIVSDSLSFEAAALSYSDDEGTKNNNGIVINPQTGSIRFPMQEIDPQLFLIIDKMDVGQMSEPTLMRSLSGDQAYRIVKLRFRSDAHRANMIEDYQLLQDMTRGSLTDKAVNDWLKKTIESTYIRIDEGMDTCPFEQDWTKKG